MSPVRTLVVEDHPLLADALTALLRREPDFEVLDPVTTVTHAKTAVAAHEPGLVVLDQHLPDGLGTDVARAMRSEGRRATIVMLTGDASDETLLAAIESGVTGFIAKSHPTDRIVALLKRAAAGEIVIPTQDLARLLARQREREVARRERERVDTILTPRDRQVLQLMARGHDTKEIATRTGLAVNTIRTHVQTIIEKLGVHSRLEAVVRANALGLVPPSGEAAGLQM